MRCRSVLAFDTNLAVHAANTASPLHEAAFAFRPICPSPVSPVPRVRRRCSP